MSFRRNARINQAYKSFRFFSFASEHFNTRENRRILLTKVMADDHIVNRSRQDMSMNDESNRME